MNHSTPSQESGPNGPSPTPPLSALLAVSVVVPCYNEIESLPQFTAQIGKVLDEIEKTQGSVELLLINDGSSDGTKEALAAYAQTEPRARVLTHEQNQGLGAALRTGFAAARGEIVVTTDADGTYDFSGIPKLLERMTPEVDVVTASPYHPEGGVEGVPAYRLVLSRGASLCYRALLSFRIYTYTSMFRAYRRKVLDEVQFSSPGYLSMAEILAESMLKGFVVAEYPAVLHVRKYGQSKAKVFRILKDHLRFQAGIAGRVARRKIGL